VASAAGEIEDVVRIVAGLNWTFLGVGLVMIGVVVLVIRARRKRSDGGVAESRGGR